MKLHHIGYAVHDIQESAAQFALLGFEPASETTEDIERNVKICFMRNQDILVELVAPLSPKSPVSNWLLKNDCSPYHFCYESRNIHEDIKYLKENGANEISKPLAAPAIEGKLAAFLYLRSLGIVELVENKD
jgi:methylmalonyl-CoA/ethylmalonyl-CoA epimerase